jgi:hypothetical protein
MSDKKLPTNDQILASMRRIIAADGLDTSDRPATMPEQFTPVERPQQREMSETATPDALSLMPSVSDLGIDQRERVSFSVRQYQIIRSALVERDTLRAELAEARARIESVTKGIDAALGALSKGTGPDHLGAISILRWEKAALAKEQPR